MGALKKPAALRELHGTDKINRYRENKNPPVVTKGIGPASSTLGDEESKIWDEVVGVMYVGVLGEADRLALEMMCRLINEMRTDFVSMTASKLTQLTSLFGRFGMTPSDRTKIVVPKAPTESRFKDYK